MGRARSKAAPRLRVVDEAGPDLSPGPQPDLAQPLGTAADTVKAVREAFAANVDWSTPCGHPIPRPRQLEGRKVQGHVAGDLWCNRPNHHTPPCRVYSADFHVLAEVKS